MTKQWWTLAEERQLMELWPDHTIPQIAEIIERPEGNIQRKASHMGLHRERKEAAVPSLTWTPRKPFGMTERLFSAWEIAHNRNPVCAVCGMQINIGEAARWARIRGRARIKHDGCGVK